MRVVSFVAVVTLALWNAGPAWAQSPVQPTAAAPPPAAASSKMSPSTASDPAPNAAPEAPSSSGTSAAPADSLEEATLAERRLVAFVAAGVSVASLAAGVTFGVLAQQQFACAQDILACNKTLEKPVVGEELFNLRAEIEQKALFADMAYLFAGASAVVAVVGFLRGFVFVDEGQTAPVAAASPLAPTRGTANDAVEFLRAPAMNAPALARSDLP
jgi:hypothetical protein